jgi:5-formyltetrahydrofolate cyclo-ligase
MMDKTQFRKHIRDIKKRYSASELRQMSAPLTSELLANDAVRSASAILLYWSLPDEVYTHDIVRQLAKEGRTVLLPKVQPDNTLTQHRYTGDADMTCGAYGIMEPATPALTDDERDTLLGKGSVSIIPGMAFSIDGHRLGRGKGYYDRLMSQLTMTFKIGLGFDFQIFKEIPHDDHDIRMDCVWHLANLPCMKQK